jgi:hypothetical protein
MVLKLEGKDIILNVNIVNLLENLYKDEWWGFDKFRNVLYKYKGEWFMVCRKFEDNIARCSILYRFIYRINIFENKLVMDLICKTEYDLLYSNDFINSLEMYLDSGKMILNNLNIIYDNNKDIMELTILCNNLILLYDILWYRYDKDKISDSYYKTLETKSQMRINLNENNFELNKDLINRVKLKMGYIDNMMPLLRVDLEDIINLKIIGMDMNEDNIINILTKVNSIYLYWKSDINGRVYLEELRYEEVDKNTKIILNNNLYNMEYYNNPCCGYSGLIIRIVDNRLGDYDLFEN